jgi:hypothetical protein
MGVVYITSIVQRQKQKNEKKNYIKSSGVQKLFFGSKRRPKRNAKEQQQSS